MNNVLYLQLKRLRQLRPYFHHYRSLNLLGFIIATLSMLAAFYIQYVLDIVPCMLCHFQRGAVVLLGVTCLLAAYHNPGKTGRIIYTLLCLVWSILGLVTAGRHIWIQNLPDDTVPACAPDLIYMLNSVPLGETLLNVWEGSGDCHSITWQLFGLSIVEYVAVIFCGYFFFSCFILIKMKRID